MKRKSETLAWAVAALALDHSVAAAGDGAPNTYEVQAGGMVIVVPKYEGSNEYEVFAVPIVAPWAAPGAEEGNIQFRGSDDLRYRLLNLTRFQAGPLAGWRFDRDELDADLLHGLGDIDGGLVLGGYAAYQFGILKPFISYHQQVTGDDTGSLVRFGSEARFSVTPQLPVVAVLGATYASENYMSTYFSISPEQASQSTAGLPVYTADPGIKDVHFNIGTDVPIADAWSLKLAAGYSHLIGDAADSPIVETENQFFGAVGITYRFGIPRW